MARLPAAHLQLRLFITSASSSTTLPSPLPILAAVLVVVSLVSFLCGSHRLRKLGGTKEGNMLPPRNSPRKDLSGCGVMALVTPTSKRITMTPWRKDTSGDSEEEGEGEGELWKKTILLGEKCQPLEFSGSILYDAQGKCVAELPPRSPRSVVGASQGGVGIGPTGASPTDMATERP